MLDNTELEDPKHTPEEGDGNVLNTNGASPANKTLVTSIALNNETAVISAPEQEKVTKLIIEKELTFTGRLPDNNTLQSAAISLKRSEHNKNGFGYYNLRDLTNTHRIEIFLKESDQEKKVELPEPMLKKIAEFLREEAALISEGFDCVSFAHFVNNIPHALGQFNAPYWNIDTFNGEEIEPGDSIIIYNELKTQSYPPTKKEIRHMAVYIGDGLYISKFGIRGRLIVTTLEEMKKGFAGAHTLKATPKSAKTNK